MSEVTIVVDSLEVGRLQTKRIMLLLRASRVGDERKINS